MENQTECNQSQAEAAKWLLVPAPNTQDQKPNQPRRADGDQTGFCVYKWSDDKTFPTSDDFASIRAIPDGAVVGIREPPPGKIPDLPDTVWQPLIGTFEKLARDIDPARWKDLAKRRTERPTKPVTVAVLDTTPKGLNERDRSLHGLIVSRVIGSLLCGDSSACSDRVRPYLALPMINAREGDLQNGGLYGTFFQLYDALSQALRDWHPADGHLVINLSLGWDPIKTDENDPRVQRIRGLLERASCMGALIVAGAGNPTGTSGPVEPAGFEVRAAPDANRCKELKAQPLPPLPKAAHVVSKSVYAPLVHAVGAVDAQDQRLLADRRWGQPRLAALGLNVMVPGPGDIRYLPPVTGTSFSTAIVSGIAAAVWSVLPELDAAGVMDLVYRGGVELDGGEKSKRARTEFCLGQYFGPCQENKVHRVHLCGALSLALAQAVPKEELVCEPSISTEVPRWPEVARSGPAPTVCRVPDCGPQGHSSNQLVAGVTTHGGVPGCPGCILHVFILQALGTLNGTPTAPDPIPANYGIKMVLKTSTLTADRLVEFNPAPPFDQVMSMPQMAVSPKTWGATMTFKYDLGGFWTADPEISLGVTKE